MKLIFQRDCKTQKKFPRISLIVSYIKIRLLPSRYYAEASNEWRLARLSLRFSAWTMEKRCNIGEPLATLCRFNRPRTRTSDL